MFQGKKQSSSELSKVYGGNKWVFSKTNIIHRHENSPFQDYSQGHKKTRKSIAYYHYLVVISSINEELVPCVFINERTD